MGKLIKNDQELARQLSLFFKRFSSACNHNTPEGNYLAHIADVLSTQEETFFASLPVKYYGRLEAPCTNNLPSYIDVDKITDRIMNFANACRGVIILSNDAIADFKPSAYVRYILNPASWPESTYATGYEDGMLWVGKRHPYKIAQESLKLAAAKNRSDTLFDKALYALVDYVLIDTSILEIYKRIAQCYEDNWGKSDIKAPCELSDLAKLLDPYTTKAKPEFDYRYRERLITPELINNLANTICF